MMDRLNRARVAGARSELLLSILDGSIDRHKVRRVLRKLDDVLGGPFPENTRKILAESGNDSRVMPVR